MDVHSHANQNSGQTLLLKIAVGLFGLGAVGLPWFAHAIDCGDQLGPGGYEVLDVDLALLNKSECATI